MNNENDEKPELPQEIVVLRDEIIRIVSIFEEGEAIKHKALTQLATSLLSTQLQLVKLAAEIEILKGEKNEY